MDKRIEPALYIDNPGFSDRIITIGAPFPEGMISANTDILPYIKGIPVTFWSQPRSFWPDGSLRWGWIHLQVPPGRSEVRIVPGKADKKNKTASLKWEDGIWTLGRDSHRVTITQEGEIFWKTENGEWNIRDAGTDLGEKELSVSDLSNVELLENSFLAPLLRITCRRQKNRRIEYLLRFIPSDSTLHISRRVTNTSAEARFLKEMGMSLDTKYDGEWEIPGVYGGKIFKFGIYKPGEYSLNGHKKKGNPELLVKNPLYGVHIEKGWQRYPVEVVVENNSILLKLFPRAGKGLLLWPGTSIRHNIMLSLGEEATSSLSLTPSWYWDPEYICPTTAMGILAPMTDKSNYLFGGFEYSVESAFNSLRRARLDTPLDRKTGPPVPLEEETNHAVEYFGLQHYGDWPLEWGRYAGENPDHRIYADNEYDIPFAFFQQFSRTGNWKYLEIARQGIIHMSDVDMDMVQGKMFYHGYRDYGEDHTLHRSPPGVGDHSWTEGLWSGYFLLGDIWAREAAEAIGRSLLKNFEGDTDDAIMRHWSSSERTVGWPMIQLAVNAESNGDKTILKKTGQMTDFLACYFSNPDRMFLNTDSFDGKKFKWFRTGAQDGTKTLMLAIVLEGLERYHRCTGDEKALETMKKIADFLITRMWDSAACMFRYEFNAYMRYHRVLDPVPGILPVRSLAYLYEKTGNDRYKTVAKEAFFGAFWVLASSAGTFDTEGNSKSIRSARDIGIVMRSANAGLYWLMKWKEDKEKEKRSLMISTSPNTWSFSGPPRDLCGDAFFSLEKGTPVFLDNGALRTTPRFNREGILTEDGDSYISGRLKNPVSTHIGTITLVVKNPWTGDEDGAVCQRGWLHLSDEKFTASALSIISFYGRIQVRFYDAERELIESLEACIKNWKPGENHKVKVAWNETTTYLIVDDEICEQRRLDRRLGGSFRQLSVGYHPAHWTFEGEILNISICLGKNEDQQ